ncbi:MAG: PAS domain-containing protein [Oligoflexia bacterium]|nr:PAS domain-containing protein [Oligoflexia bacterium]
MIRRPPWALLVLTALACSSLAFVLQGLLRQQGGESRFVLFFPAVFASALLGGFWAGVVSAASLVLASLLLLPALGIPVEYAIFLVAALIMSHLTERLSIGQQLKIQDLEARLPTPAAFGPQMVFTALPSGGFEFANRVWFSYTGLGPEETAAGGWLRIVHPEDTQAMVNRWRMAQQTGSFEIESRLRRASDGEYRWQLIRALPLRDREGKIRHWFGTIVDIDGLKRAEEDLRQSREQFRVMGESLPYGVWRASLAGEMEYFSQSFLDLLSMSMEEARGSGWLRKLEPDSAQAIRVNWLARVPEGEPWEQELRLRDGSGRVHTVLSRGLPVKDLTGKVTSWVGINLDIDDRKEAEDRLRRSEERLRLAAETSNVAIWDWDLRPQWRPAPQAIRWTGSRELIFGPGEVPLRTGWDEFVRRVHPEDRERVTLAAESAVRGRSDMDVEFRIIWPDGSVHWIRSKGHVFVDAAGQALRVVGAQIDTTESKLAEMQTEKLLEEAREALRARDEFLSIASHELMTPLTSLHMQLQLLRRRIGPNATLEICERQSRRLSALVEELLDLTRIRLGKLSIELTEVKLGELINEVLLRLTPQIAQAGSKVDVRVEPELKGRWDRARIDQVVTNLLTNALKYGEGRPITLEAGHGIDLAGRKVVRIAVRDQGRGIPRALQTRIFERFERAVNGAEIAGLGLGLYIVRQIVEAHQGRIGVESEEGQGATFTVELPPEPEGKLQAA